MTERPTKADALEALDSLDDYARMTVGVDAAGPRECLERFIEGLSADGIAASFTAWADAEFGPAPDPAVPQTERYASYFKCWRAAKQT